MQMSYLDAPKSPSQMFFFYTDETDRHGPQYQNGTFCRPSPPSALQSCNSIHVFGSRPRMGSGVRYEMAAERFDLSKRTKRKIGIFCAFYSHKRAAQSISDAIKSSPRSWFYRDSFHFSVGMGWGDLPGRPGGRVAMAVIYLAVWRDKRAKFQTETVSSNFQTARKKADCFEGEWPFRGKDEGGGGDAATRILRPPRSGVMGHFLKS